MLEVPSAGEDHGDIRLVGGSDDLFIPYRPSRLGDGLDASGGRHLDVVGEWEERV